MYPQQIVILVCVIGAVCFLAYGSASGTLRRVVIPSILLLAAAGYEAYMFYVWEKKVIAPIRVDLLLEIPLILILLVYGVVVSVRQRIQPR